MKILLILLIAIFAQSLKIKFKLGAEEQRCFYQSLQPGQKYAIEVSPINEGTYQVDIRHKVSDEWLHSVHRTVKVAMQNVTLYKIASSEALYSFCLINTALSILELRVDLRCGLELLDLQVLAQQTDQEQILREARWIDKQADKFLQAVNSAAIQRNNREQLNNMMGVTMLLFAIIGFIFFFLTSVYFYYSAKKTFRQRKMI